MNDPWSGSTELTIDSAPAGSICVPFKAWKYVDEEHAQAIEAGVLRIGTLADYANLENGRADAADGSIIAHLEKFYPDGKRELRLERFGIKGVENIQDGALIDITVGEPCWPGWAFCMSQPGTAFVHPDGKPQALFEVRVHLLVRSLTQRYAADLGLEPIIVAPVAYAPRTFDMLNVGDGYADAFLKDPKFQEEREVRIFLPVREARRLDPFFTAENSIIASCFKRLA